MSPNITEKLNKFSSLVIQDAQNKRREILDEVEKEYTERLDEKESELLGGAYEVIQRNKQKAQKNANERVLHTELDAKKRLIVKREEIIESVMSEAERKLGEFTKSEEYEKWLIEKTEKAFFELGKGRKTVYISSEDIRLRDKIEALDEGVTVEAESERGFIGGVRVTNTDKKVAVDYSFKEMLSEQKQKFLRESGLTLD